MEVSADSVLIGFIRRHGGAWQWGTINDDEEFPEHWVDLISRPFGRMAGILDAKEKLLKLLE